MPQEISGDSKGSTSTYSGRIAMGKIYRDTPDGPEYFGKFLNSGNPLKTEFFRGKNDSYTKKSLFGVESAAGDTSYYETSNVSRSMNILRAKENMDIRSAVMGASNPVDIGESSPSDYLKNWGTPPVSQIKKDVTSKVMGFLKGLKR